MLSIVPQASLPSPIIDNWLPDSAVRVTLVNRVLIVHQVATCPLSGKPFGLFTRRHHCRVSGQILVDECCDYRQYLPDFGYYASQQRVADSHIGLSSCDPLEDVMLFCDKKSEVRSLVRFMSC